MKYSCGGATITLLPRPSIVNIACLDFCERTDSLTRSQFYLGIGGVPTTYWYQLLTGGPGDASRYHGSSLNGFHQPQWLSGGSGPGSTAPNHLLRPPWDGDRFVVAHHTDKGRTLFVDTDHCPGGYLKGSILEG